MHDGDDRLEVVGGEDHVGGFDGHRELPSTFGVQVVSTALTVVPVGEGERTITPGRTGVVGTGMSRRG